MKRLGARSRAMVLSCLNKQSDDGNGSVPDFLDDSRSSSPIQISADCLGLRNNDNSENVASQLHKESLNETTNSAVSLLTPLQSKECVELPSYSVLTPASTTSKVLTETGFDKSVELPSYCPLTPAPNNSKAIVYESDILTETASEKSVEPPPYSPLTPAPNNSKKVVNESDVLTETASEKSVEPPPYSPLTPAPPNALPTNQSTLLFNTAAEHNCDSPLSPVPLMSPNTANMCTILAESLGPVCNEDCSYSTYSDDSVKDPDYDDNSDDSSSSIDDFTSGTVHVDIHPIPQERRFFNVQSNAVSLGPCSPQNDLSENDEIVSALELTSASERVDTHNCRSSTEIVSDKELSQNDTHVGRPKRGRKRKYGDLLREDRKKKKYMNLPYINSNKKSVDAKIFIDYQCKCKNKCHETASLEKRMAEFERFYSLGSYNAQNMFINALVKERPVKRHYISTESKNKPSKPKKFARQYFIAGISVCKDMFVKTLQTSSKRINTSLFKMRTENASIDKRGSKTGLDKMTPECVQFVIDFIKLLPTYISHYRREQCNGVKYLRSDMTQSKMYELYTEKAKSDNMRTVSKSKLYQIFVTHFNLRTKPLKKDTCNKCDYFQSQIQTASNDKEAEMVQKRNVHQDMATFLQNQLKTDMKLAKDDPSVETITFDLEKTLPLPRIPTNIVFYKRQLWVYNLGIHTGSRDEAHCNVWVEGEAGRGAQEVGSCLNRHIRERLDSSVTRLILWSDSCGGQNRNIKLVLMLKAILNDHPTLEYINLRFLESGHSFLPNDRDFAKIENALKRQQRIYTPDDYMDIMKTCKKTNAMKVHRMEKQDFLSSLMLEKNITNRKKCTDGTKVSWLTTKEIELRKHDMYTIFMRSNFTEEFKDVDIKKKTRGSALSTLSVQLMQPLWPTGKPVPDAKLKDLKSLLHLIPQAHQDFYVKLVPDENIEDDLEGYSGEPDFEIEDDSPQND